MTTPIPSSPNKMTSNNEIFWNSRGSRNAWRHFYLPVGLITILIAMSVYLYSNQYGREWAASQVQISMLAQQQQQQHKLAAQISDLTADQSAVHNLLKSLETLVKSKCSSSQPLEHKSAAFDEAITEKFNPTQPVATPAAAAALPQLITLHNAVLRSSQDFDKHRAVTQQLLDKLVHMEAGTAQQVSRAEAACACGTHCHHVFITRCHQCSISAAASAVSVVLLPWPAGKPGSGCGSHDASVAQPLLEWQRTVCTTTAKLHSNQPGSVACSHSTPHESLL
jgi:hypothetical protein